MQRRYDPRQSLSTALERWSVNTVRVVLESKAVPVAEWPREGDAHELADGIVTAAEDYCAAAGRDVLFQVLGYTEAGTVTGSMPLRVRSVSDGDGLTGEKVLQSVLAQNEKLQTTLVESVKSLTDTSAKVLELVSKRLEHVEKERSELAEKAATAERLAADSLEAAEALAKGEKKDPVDKVLSFLEKVYERDGMAGFRALLERGEAAKPEPVKVDATNAPTEVVGGG